MKNNEFKAAFKKELPFFMMAPALIWQVLFFYFPIAIIIVLSLYKCGAIPANISFANYRVLATSSHILIILRSLLFAFINACVCLLFAYPVSYFLARKIKKLKNFMVFFLILPFWINIVVQIYSWYFVLERNGMINWVLLKLGIISQPLHLLNTMPSILLVMMYCYLPFMIMPLYSILEKIDERLIESSFDLGANSWQTFFKVTLPLSWPGIKTGFFLVFVPSFGEFIIPALVGGSKNMFVGSLISHYFLTAHDVNVGAAFTIVSGLLLLFMAFCINWYFGRKTIVSKGQ